MTVRPRWWELVPEAVLAIGLAGFLLLETDAATSAFASSTAIALMAATTLGWLALRIGLGRLGPRWAPVRTGLFAVGAAAVLAVVVVPAFDDTTVVETLVADTGTGADTDTDTDTVVGSGADPAAPAAPVPTVSEVTSTTAPPGPQVLRTGELHGIDHRARGTVRLYRQPSGALVVGLEDLDVQPGPDYDVFVVPGAGREGIDGGTRLDDLRGNKGTQYYEVPSGIDVGSGEWTVLVWCQTFDVPVAAATPT